MLQLTSDTSTEQRRAALHVQLLWQDNTILIIHSRILLEEAVVDEAQESRLLPHTPQVMNHTSLTLEAAPVEVVEADGVSHLEPFPLRRRVDSVNEADAFVADRAGALWT